MWKKSKDSEATLGLYDILDKGEREKHAILHFRSETERFTGRQLRKSRSYMAGGFLQGSSEAAGHGGPQLTALPEALLFARLNPNKAKANILRSPSRDKFFCLNLWGGKEGEGQNFFLSLLFLYKQLKIDIPKKAA